MITTEIAYNIRCERGLRLPVNREYETERLAEIARRQGELLDELTALDNEIILLYQQGNHVTIKRKGGDLPGQTTFDFDI
jgi:hypothetical protein